MSKSSYSNRDKTVGFFDCFDNTNEEEKRSCSEEDCSKSSIIIGLFLERGRTLGVVALKSVIGGVILSESLSFYSRSSWDFILRPFKLGLIIVSSL